MDPSYAIYLFGDVVGVEFWQHVSNHSLVSIRFNFEVWGLHTTQEAAQYFEYGFYTHSTNDGVSLGRAVLVDNDSRFAVILCPSFIHTGDFAVLLPKP